MEKEIVYRVQENPDYIKDQSTGAILNTNIAKLRDYKLRKKQSQKIEHLRDEVDDLKNLLRQVLEERKCQSQ